MDKLTLTRQFQIQLGIFFGRYWEGVEIIERGKGSNYFERIERGAV
jgi:hypothetical protein